MKRVTNDVALCTVMYVIGGIQKIKIIDYVNETAAQWKGDAKEVFKGEAKDAIKVLNFRYERAKVRSIRTEGEELIIAICTSSERY